MECTAKAPLRSVARFDEHDRDFQFIVKGSFGCVERRWRSGDGPERGDGVQYPRRCCGLWAVSIFPECCGIVQCLGEPTTPFLSDISASVRSRDCCTSSCKNREICFRSRTGTLSSIVWITACRFSSHRGVKTGFFSSLIRTESTDKKRSYVRKLR